MLPDKIFFTGVPGSKWSGISQVIESMPGFNTSDRTEERTYSSTKYSGHIGAYFGEGMEFDAVPCSKHIDQAWPEPGGCKVVKSHDWAYKLDYIKLKFPDQWIMMVYRPDFASYAWWHEAGGFNISYPDYSAYRNSQGMLTAISAQNISILEFGRKHNATWNYFTTEWCEEHFNHTPEMKKFPADILVTLIK